LAAVWELPILDLGLCSPIFSDRTADKLDYCTRLPVFFGTKNFIPDKVSGKTSTLALATKAGPAFNAGDQSVNDFVILFEPIPE